jgi:hypothetical protein
LSRLLLAAFLLCAAGCASIPVESGAVSRCRAWGRESAGEGFPCQHRLVIGFFPAIGEAHLNRLATNGKPLSGGLRAADYTLRPLYVVALNALSLGFPTARAWLLEPYDEWDPAPAACGLALLGYCKTGMIRPPTAEEE